MNTSLRDQLLKAGLINKKQANDAERQQQRQERQTKSKPHPAGASERPSAPQGAKVARDQALNRQQQEKAEKKARLAQIKQLIEQNRLSAFEGDQPYNFVDGSKIRRIAVNAAIRDQLGRGAIAIVRHDCGYDLVPMAIAQRIRERDERAVIPPAVDTQQASGDPAYDSFAVPDDLIW
jgi:uncharacterized protein YaiL (DUF2058 family)